MRRFIAALAFSFTALATPVCAEELTRVIPVTPADLQSEASVAALYDRVENAAKALCSKANPNLYAFNDTTLKSRTACIREAMDRAMINAGSPTLAARHAQVLAAARPVGRTETLAAR